MKRSCLLKFITITFLLFLQLKASAQVNVSIQILPPYPTKFTDYAMRPQLMIIALTNTSTTSQRIQLRGSVNGDNGIIVRSKSGYKSSSPIELTAGQTTTLNGSNLAHFFDYTDLEYTGITQNDFVNKGGLPEGRYQLCIRAYNYDTNDPLSADEPGGCSNTFTISSLEPPVILSPVADQVLPSGPGQIFSIRWNTPVSTPPGIRYKIRMVEILGDRNPNDAILSATQPYFFEKEVMTNMYVYNPADPQLTPGRKYALMIEAFDPFNNAVFRNNGRSEVVMFTYGQPVTQEQEVIVVNSDTLPKKLVVIKGRLKYRFPESPESGVFSIKHTKVYLEKVYVQEKTDTLAVKSWQPLNAVLAGQIPFLNDPMDGVLAETDEEGNFELKVGMTVLDSAGLLSNYHQKLLGLDQKIAGNIAAKQLMRNNTDNIGIMYRLRISNPHFKDYEEYLRIVPGDTVDLQQRIVDANSYQLNVNVAESFNGQTGKYVPGALVRIYRLKADKINPNLAIPFYEGDLLDSAANWKEYGDKVLIAEATTPTPDSLVVNDGLNADPFTVSFKRLFRNLGQDGYRYLISLEKGEQVIGQLSFDALNKIKTVQKRTGLQWQQAESGQARDVWENFSYNQHLDTTQLTLHKELTAAPRSKVTGTLKYRFKYYTGVSNQPYANMKVSLRSSTDLKSVVATAVTDAEGRFVFDFANVDSTYSARAVRQGGRTVGFDQRVYYVVPEVKYYAVPNDAILVQPWGNYDCGELVSLVQTYSLKIDAKGENDEALPQAEVLALRYRPETYKDQLPNLPEMNIGQEISFGNGNSNTNNYTVGNGQNTSIVHIEGETGDRENQYILQRKVYTEADGGTVVLKGLIPSIDMDNDRYQIRIGSADRSSNNVAYETEIFNYPETRFRGSPPDIKAIDEGRLTVEGRIQGEKDKLYDPSWGYQNMATFDPSGAVIMPGLGMDILTVNGMGVAGNTLKVNQLKAIGGGRMGYAMHQDQDKALFNSREWRSLAQHLQQDQQVLKKQINNFGFYIAGPLIVDTAIVFNNQLSNVEPVYEDSVIISKKDWRIAGRAIDSVSRLGVKNVQISLLQKIGDGNLDQTYGFVSANDNGDFVLTEATMSNYGTTSWNSEKNVSLGLYAPGYKPKIIRDFGKMTKGKQFYDEQIILEPLGKGLYGYVVDKDNPLRGVPARIKMIDNGMWVNTVAYQGKKYNNNTYNANEEVRDQQRFTINLPATQVKLVIMPYDRAYLTDTIKVDVRQGNLFLGVFSLTPRKHKVRIAVMHEKDQLVPALVTLVENEMQDTIRQFSGTLNETTAYFEFVNNATKNFTVHVKPLSLTPVPGKKMFVPQTFTLQNEDDGKEKHYILEVAPGRPVSGKVTFSTGEMVNGAKVYLESGSGGATDNFALTNVQGEYNIVLPQVGVNQYTIRANYFEEGKTYVSAEKTVSPEENRVDLVIKKIEGIDVSRLLGFKTRINTLDEGGDGTYVISGEFYDIPANPNFSTTDSLLNRNLTFTDVKIKASAFKNAKGVPLAVPLENTITTDNKELAVKINKAFNGMVHGPADERIVINKAVTDSSGTIMGKVRILDNSFQFPSSYMRMESTDFYLGIHTGAEAMPIFSSSGGNSIAERFLLTNKQGTPINFSYLGFKGIAETQGNRSSNLTGESIHLFMNLSTILPGNIPLTLKAGEANISKGGVGRIITSDTLSFNLEDWSVKSLKKPGAGISTDVDNSTWELSPTSGGLVIKNGEILTNKLNIPFTNMTIIPGEEGFPGELICPDLKDEASLKNANFTIGGIAKLKMKTGAAAMFVYDPGVGRDGAGHYKLSITSANYNDYAASFSGLDGMTNPGEGYKIQIISMLSNGEELFGFVNNQVITYYNQVKFMPKTLSATSQNSFSIAGSIDLGIPSLNTKFFETLVYSKNGNKNKLTLPVFDFSFMGKGSAKFTSIVRREAQQFRPEGFVIAGNLTLPGGVNLNGSKLIAMVTNGAKDLIDPNGIGSLVSNAVNNPVSREIDVLFGAKEKAEGYFNDIRSDLDAKISAAKDELLNVAENAVKDEVTKLIPMGTDAAKGALDQLAGAWKLGKQGQDISEALTEGNYMRLAGMMKNIPGVNEVAQDVKNAVVMNVNNSLNAVQDSLPEFKDVPVGGDGFEPGNFEFDLKNGRIFGSITFKIISLGAVGLRNGGMEMLFDRDGWYFCSGATMDIPVPLITPLKVGVLIGNYASISDELEGRVTKMAQSVSDRLPPAVKRGLSGFFVVGGKPIADVDIGFGISPIAEFKLVASAGAEVRTYALFGKGSFTMGMGALAYGRVYASASALGVSVTGGAELNVAIASTATVSNGDFGLCAQGCISLRMYLEACALGQCGSLDASIMALLNMGVGSNSILRGTGCGKSGIGFSLSTGTGSCINNPGFDF